MSLHEKALVPRELPTTMSRGMEIIVASRTTIARDGWPDSWHLLYARSTLDARDDYQRRQMSLGEVTRAAYTPSLQQAFFREGVNDQACLVAQAW